MAERPPSLSNKMEKCPCVAPPQQHNEMEQFQLLQKGRDRTQQQDSALSCWRSAGQKFTNLTGTWCQEMITMLTKGEAKPGPALPQSIAAAPSLDLFEERVVSSSSQVPGFVRNMHQRLVSNGPPDDRLFMDILRLTDAHSTDVAVTLLRCAPSCDRGAATMWKTIASSGTTMEKVLPTLLCVLEDWPVRRMYTSDGDNKDVFALAVLEFLNFKEWGDTILDIMARHLQSESKDRCRLALRGLVVLSKDHSMAKKMCSLSGSLVELLRNEDVDVVRMTLSVLRNVLLNKDILVSSPTAPKLAEVLQPLFDHDNHLVQLLSIRLYKDVMESVVRKGKKRLKMLVSESLLPLFFHCHDENVRVAEASRETLLSVVKFLKRKDLKQLLKMEDPWSFGERVLAEDRSRAAEHLQRALPYLESPQESLREAAVRSIGIAGLLMKGQPEELQLICEALQALNTDDSPSNTNLIVQVMFDERATSLNSSSGSKQPGQYQIPCRRRAPGDQRPAGASDPADAGDT
ncbi:uncharacterized protein M8220_004604 isoform 4-T5 [Acridotheres tristis]